MKRENRSSFSKPSCSTVLGIVVVLIMVVGGVFKGVSFVQRKMVISRLEKLGGEYAESSYSHQDFSMTGHSVDFDATTTDDTIIQSHYDLRAISGLMLDLEESAISDQAMEALAGATNIFRLNVGGTKVTSEGVKHIATMENLVMLNLSECPITDEGLAHLKALKKLRYLYLTSTLITDEGLRHLEELSQLKQVSMGWGSITPDGAKALQELLPGTEVHRVGPPFDDPIADTRVTAENGQPIPDDGGELIAVCRQYFEALHKRDVFTLKSLWSRSVSVSFKTISDDVLEIRPTSINTFSGFMNDKSATVSVHGPVPDGHDVQYDVQFVKEEDQWRIVRLFMVF